MQETREPLFKEEPDAPEDGEARAEEGRADRRRDPERTCPECQGAGPSACLCILSLSPRQRPVFAPRPATAAGRALGARAVGPAGATFVPATTACDPTRTAHHA